MRFELGLDFLDRCARDEPVDTLIAAFKALIAEFGFQGSACGSWDGIGKDRANRFFYVDWPEDVMRRYAEQNLAQHDPLVFEARRRMTPYVWDEVRHEPDLPDASRAMYRFAEEFGWMDGFCVPIHGPGGYQGLVSLLARQTVTLTARERGLLETAARALHDRCRRTLGFGASPLVPHLTAREAECMKWVAAGKTDWEIGQVLGISSATVHFHVENAKKKLGRSTRTEAVAVLVMHGLL